MFWIIGLIVIIIFFNKEKIREAHLEKYVIFIILIIMFFNFTNAIMFIILLFLLMYTIDGYKNFIKNYIKNMTLKKLLITLVVFSTVIILSSYTKDFYNKCVSESQNKYKQATEEQEEGKDYKDVYPQQEQEKDNIKGFKGHYEEGRK